MSERKLKDLRIGDKMWLYDFTDTTPITVVKKKREAELITITLKWDDEVFDCFGPALGWTCVCYSIKGNSKGFLPRHMIWHMSVRNVKNVSFNSLIIRRSLSKRLKKSVARHWK